MSASNARLSRDEVQARLRDGRADLESALAALPATRWEEPLLEGGWSVKDTLAHLVHWQNSVVEQLGWPAGRPRERMDAAAIERINSAVYARYHEEPLEAVRAAYESATQSFAAAFAALSDEQLHDPQRWAWTEGEPVVSWAAADGWEHFGEHADNIRKAVAHAT